AAAAPAAAAEPREFDRVLTFVERTLDAPHRSLPDGGLLFQELCSKCHLRGSWGKAVGPDLTTIGARFGPRDLLESILAPSRTISDQYRGLNVILKNGDIVSGMPLVADERHVLLVDLRGEQVDLKAEQIERRRPATKSVMPEGLLDALSYEQIADLTAWLLAPKIVEPAKAAAWQALPATAGGAAVISAPADFAFEFEARLGDKEQLYSCWFRSDAGAQGQGTRGYAVDGGRSAWGRLRDLGGRGVIVQPRQEIWWPLPERTGWNHFLIEARGDRITVRLNGSITVDNEDRDGPAAGGIGFELPADAPGSVQIRHARLRPR
ncbi:MAG: DUF1080 domain-containing protein, partial [Planctomycetes bacterium]|nr:DUF1080 domain-containing protein [Planctomycetota bacterium]